MAFEGQIPSITHTDLQQRRDKLLQIIFKAIDDALLDKVVNDGFDNLSRDQSKEAATLKERIRRAYPQANGMRPFQNRAGTQFFSEQIKRIIRKDAYLQGVVVSHWSKEHQAWLNLLKECASSTILTESQRDFSLLEQNPSQIFELSMELSDVCRETAISPREMALFIKWQAQQPTENFCGNNCTEQMGADVALLSAAPPPPSEAFQLLDEAWEYLNQVPVDALDWDEIIAKLSALLEAAQEKQQASKSLNLLKTRLAEFTEKWQLELNYFEIAYADWEISDLIQVDPDEINATLEDLNSPLSEARQLRGRKAENRSQEKEINQRMNFLEAGVQTAVGRLSASFFPQRTRTPSKTSPTTVDSISDASNEHEQTSISAEDADEEDHQPTQASGLQAPLTESSGVCTGETNAIIGGDSDVVLVTSLQYLPAEMDCDPIANGNRYAEEDDEPLLVISPEPEPLLSAVSAAQQALDHPQDDRSWRTLLYALIADGNLPLAYWLVSSSPKIGWGSNGETIINADLIAALAGARQATFPSDDLAAELFGFLSNCPRDAGRAAEFFRLAANLAPMLTMPQSVNGFLHEFYLEDAVCKPFRQLIHMLSEFRRQYPYQPFHATTLSALATEEALQERTRTITKQAATLIIEGPSYQFSYGGSGRVWRHLLSEQSEIGKALRSAGEGARARVVEVAAIAHRWKDEEFVVEQIHRINQESHHQRHPGEIVGTSFRQLREQLAEAVTLLSEWSQLVDERQRPSLLGDRLREDLKRLRDGLTEALPQCQRAAETIFAEFVDTDAATSAAARMLSKTLADVNGLLEWKAQSSPSPSKNTVSQTLHQALWQMPELELPADGLPAPTHLSRIPRLIAESIITPRQTESVIKLWLEQGRYEMAARLIEQDDEKGQLTDETRRAVAESQRQAEASLSARVRCLQGKIDELRLGTPAAEERLGILMEEVTSIAAKTVKHSESSWQRLDRIETELRIIEANCLERLRRDAGMRWMKEQQDAVEADLVPLIEKLDEAIGQRRTVLCLSLWQPLRFFSMLPFHMHLKWPDLIESLPLNVTSTLLPFTSRDELLARSNLYEVASVARNRRDARTNRIRSQRHGQDDGKACDWELSLTQERSKRLPPHLPGPSFLAIDRVTAKGGLRRGSRPVLGRIARRDAHRPSFLTASHGTLTDEAARTLRQTNLLLVNLQGIKGRKSLANLHQVLKTENEQQPTLILASSPIELLALAEQYDLPEAHYLIREPEWWPRSLRVHTIGHDRAQREKQFEQAFAPMRGISAELDHVIELARHAWWELRQRIVKEAPGSGAYRRFLTALDHLTRFAPQDARLLTQGRELLEQELGSPASAQERYAAIAHLVNETPAGSTTIILTRDKASAAALQDEMSAKLGYMANELSVQGISVQSYRHFHEMPDAAMPINRLIVTGYFGMPTIDAIQIRQADQIHFIFDPIEVLTAWYGTGRMKRAIEPFNAQRSMRSLEQLADCLREHLPCRIEEVEFAFPWLSSSEPSIIRSNPVALHKDEAIIVLNDGTQLWVSRHSHFDVLTHESMATQGRPRAALKRVTAARLQCGDEIILLHDDLQASFSARMLKAVDAGYLKDLAEARQNWATLIKAMTMRDEVPVRKIKEQMADLNEEVDESTIRTWLKINEDFSLDDETRMPESFNRFAAFARVIGIGLPEEQLRDHYEKIHRLRVEHRRAGRRLVAAVKNVYLNGYDVASLAKIEHYYGLAVRELVQGARPAMVDEVILAEGENDEIER